MNILRIVHRLLLNMAIFLILGVLKVFPRRGVALSALMNRVLQIVTTVNTDCGPLTFHTPSWLTKYRADTLFVKEPETIAWIDSFMPNSVFYDVGANVGTYSIYAAATRSCEVFAFEPSAPNQDLLIRNIIKNQLNNLITVFPVGLSDKNSLENMYFNLSSFSWGGAHHSLGVNINQKGLPVGDVDSVKLPALKLDSLVEIFDLPRPDHIKIDVDGLETLVLLGAQKTLGLAKSIMIEVDPDHINSSLNVPKILEEFGLKLQSSFAENSLYVRKT